jgi:probable O-glycosylation ligase (exosortase A-associated)
MEFGRPMDWIRPLDLIHPGMIVAIWGFGAVLFMRDRPRLPKPLKYMLAFLALMAWQVPWAMNNRWALWGMRDYAVLILGGVLPLAVLPTNFGSVKNLLGAYVALHVPMALHGLLHAGTGQGGWITDENDLALALNAALGVGLFLFLEAHTAARKLWLLVCLTMFVAGVAATRSRGGFVGLATLGAVVFFVSPPRRKLIVVMVVIIAVLGLAVLAPAQYWSRIQTIQTASGEGDTGFQRLYMWGLAWRMFLHHPVFGVGTNNYGIQAPYYEDTAYAEQAGVYLWGRVCHSLYFTVLSEQGLVGTTLFVLVLGWTFATGRKIRRRAAVRHENPDAVSAEFFATGLLAGVIGVLVSGAFLTVLYYPVLWVLVGLMAALDRACAGILAVPVEPKTVDPPRRRMDVRRRASQSPLMIGQTP